MSNTIIHCTCGAKVSLSHAQPGQKYRCPKCKQPIIAGASDPVVAKQAPQPVHQHAQTGHVPTGGPIHVGGGAAYAAPMSPPQPANGLAVTGFVLSLASFFLILLAPIAFIVSIMGLRKPNSGLAVAGAVISAFQSICLALFLVLFFGLGWFTWTVAKEATEMVGEIAEDVEIYTKTELTKTTLGDAGEEIDAIALATSELPDAKEGAEIVKHFKDAWGNPVRYELNETELASYSIISPGPDGEAETSDDVGVSRPSCAPQNFQEAIALLGGLTDSQRQAGIKWANTNSPEDVDASKTDQHTMVDRLSVPLSSGILEAEAIEAIKNWLADDAIDTFARRIISEVTVPPVEVIELLIELEQQEAVLKMLNHPDSVVRSRVARYVRAEEVNNEVVIEQCLTDLNDMEHGENAITYLRSMPLDEDERQELTERLCDALLFESVNMRITSSTVSLINDYKGDKDLVPRWIEIYEKTFDRDVRAQLLNSKDARVAEHFAPKLNTPGRIAGESRTLLKELGPVAEDAVLRRLESAPTTGSARPFIIEVLQEVGTEKSIPALEELADDRFIGSRATEAIAAIRERAN